MQIYGNEKERRTLRREVRGWRGSPQSGLGRKECEISKYGPGERLRDGELDKKGWRTSVVLWGHRAGRCPQIPSAWLTRYWLMDQEFVVSQESGSWEAKTARMTYHLRALAWREWDRPSHRCRGMGRGFLKSWREFKCEREREWAMEWQLLSGKEGSCGPEGGWYYVLGWGANTVL